MGDADPAPGPHEGISLPRCRVTQSTAPSTHGPGEAGRAGLVGGASLAWCPRALARALPGPPAPQPGGGGCLLVVLSGHVKAPQKDVRVAQVAVGSPLCRFVSKFLSDGQALRTQMQGLGWSQGSPAPAAGGRAAHPPGTASPTSTCPGGSPGAPAPSPGRARSWGQPRHPAQEPWYPAQVEPGAGGSLPPRSPPWARPWPLGSCPAKGWGQPAAPLTLWKAMASGKLPSEGLEAARHPAHLLVEGRGFCEAAQQVVGVPQVAIGPALGRPVTQLLHQGQVPPGGPVRVSRIPASNAPPPAQAKGC